MTLKQVYVTTREDWRAWLEAHHATSKEVWVVFFKAHTGKPVLDYGAAVEEALCFGWVDSLIRRLDEDRYARKFTPRREGSVWSQSNKDRVARMVQAGKMTEAGMRLVRAAQASGAWGAVPERPEVPTDVPEELARGLAMNPTAEAFFESLAPTHQKRFLMWVGMAKRAATREKRAAEAVRLLAKGEKLGLR